MSQPAAKRQKTSEQKELEKQLQTIKTELRAVKNSRRTPETYIEPNDVYIEKLGEANGKKMKRFVGSIATLHALRTVHGSSQAMLQISAGTSGVEAERICTVCTLGYICLLTKYDSLFIGGKSRA
jgi:hypothetical protein